jgi:DNA repair exonuclease SbcCD nuclease subunit
MVLTAPDDPFDTWVSPDGELRIVGLPYQDVATDKLLLALNDRAPFDGTDVFLFHGSLDAPVDADAGAESARRYFPVTESQLAGLGFDYYLAGHYHGAHQRQFDTGAWFAYPGTPASTRQSETGRRQAVTLDTNAGLDFTPLETFHHRVHEVTIIPGEEEAVLETIADWVATHTTQHAELSITVEGLIGMPETEFATRLAEAAGPADVTNRTASVDAVIDHPVLVEMQTRLDERDWDDETSKAVWLRTLQAASTVYSSRGGL